MNCKRLEYTLLLIATMMFGQSVSVAESLQPVSMSAEAFSRLSANDQRSLLVRVFERRLEHARNLHYEVQESMAWHEYHDGKIGKLLKEGDRPQFRHWLLNGSYRMDIDWPASPTDNEIISRVSTGYNAEKGVRRSAMHRKEVKTGRGRIDVREDPAIESSEYIYWLVGKYPHKEDYLFQYLLDHQNEFDIKAPVEEDKVQLTVNYQPWWAKKPGGKRVFILDPQKGFIPIRGDSRWDAPPVKGRDNWRLEKFVVEESRLVGDVWMPIKLTNKITGSPIYPKIGVYQMEVSRIEHGTVKTADLVMPFTEGMEIVDAIKGIGYVADAKGNPAQMFPLAGAGQRPISLDKLKKMAIREESRGFAIPIISGALIFFVAWFLLRRMRRRTTSA